MRDTSAQIELIKTIIGRLGEVSFALKLGPANVASSAEET